MSTSVSVAAWATGPAVPPAELLGLVLVGVCCVLVASFGHCGGTPRHRLDDTQLVHAWRTTTRALRARRAPDEQLAIAAWREEYLDEMEHRHGDGFRAWLTDGGGDDESLERFLLGGPG